MTGVNVGNATDAEDDMTDDDDDDDDDEAGGAETNEVGGFGSDGDDPNSIVCDGCINPPRTSVTVPSVTVGIGPVKMTYARSAERYT